MAAFLTFVGKYWLTVLFGLIAGGLGYIAKKYYKLYKKGKSVETQEKEDMVLKKTQDIIDAKLDGIVETLNLLREGVLSIQGEKFKDDCRFWLQDDNDITIEVYTRLEELHRVYNSLGGNHEGDLLFNLVTTKYESSL